MTESNTLTQDQIAEQLLAHLRAASGDDLEYIEPPKQLTGGFDTLTYAFTVSADSGDFAGPLILRIFNPKTVNQPLREAVFQNALADLNYPVPRVVYRAEKPAIEGHLFNVMQRVPGRNMGEAMFQQPGMLAEMPQRLADVHARLHNTPSGPVMEAVTAAGMDPDAFSPFHRLNEVRRALADPALSHLQPVLDWLEAHRPPERDETSVCHGDFHPGNVMVDDEGNVTGLIDWAGAAFADPEHDVAIILVLVATVAVVVYPDLRPHLEGFRDAYLDAYCQFRATDRDRVGYYEVLRCTPAFVRGTAALTPGVDMSVQPREHYPWANIPALEATAARIQDITAIELPLPLSPS